MTRLLGYTGCRRWAGRPASGSTLCMQAHLPGRGRGFRCCATWVSPLPAQGSHLRSELSWLQGHDTDPGGVGSASSLHLTKSSAHHTRGTARRSPVTIHPNPAVPYRYLRLLLRLPSYRNEVAHEILFCVNSVAAPPAFITYRRRLRRFRGRKRAGSSPSKKPSIRIALLFLPHVLLQKQRHQDDRHDHNAQQHNSISRPWFGQVPRRRCRGNGLIKRRCSQTGAGPKLESRVAALYTWAGPAVAGEKAKAKVSPLASMSTGHRMRRSALFMSGMSISRASG